MELHVISIFPDMFGAVSDYGVIGRAVRQQVLTITVHNPRDYAPDKRSTVDDRPYGGGPGMVMSAEPLSKAIKAARAAIADKCGDSVASDARVIYLSPQGERFKQSTAQALAAQAKHQPTALILLAGRYEGVDERLLASEVDEEWSIGDFVLSGGELPAMVVIDAIARLLPDSLGNNESAEQDSFSQGLLDCPHYTRPEVYAEQAVPEVLLSGDHKAIAQWRMKQSLGRTWLRRPELLNKLDLTEAQLALLEEFKREL